jgi:hypothetical protein
MPLEQTIIDSKKLTELPRDWDGEDALPISDSTWLAAVTILRRMNIEYFSRTNLQILCPFIGPCADGSIDLFWKTIDHNMIINIVYKNSLTKICYSLVTQNNQVNGSFNMADDIPKLLIDHLINNDLRCLNAK